jgi:rubrerythrin
MKTTLVFLATAIVCLGLVTTVKAQKPAEVTLQNLQTAFNGESNAHARYVAFAAKAEQEGYLQVANLFRAAAKAEEIHARNHEVEIKRLGGTAQAALETPSVKSTRENLGSAIAGETYERDVMYPGFYAQARSAGDAGSVQTFNYAQSAETEHASLFAAALNNLENMRAKGSQYFVCTVCGYTTTKIDFAKCHTCFSPKDKYVAVT